MTAITSLDAKTDLAAVVIGGAINESVMQKIWDVSRVPLPFTDRVGTGSCSAAQQDWVRDRLAAGADNAFVETAETPITGASAVTVVQDASVQPLNRYRNHVQVSARVAVVTELSNLVSSVGGSGGIAYQIMKAQRQLKQDIEYMITARTQASLAGNGTTIAPRCNSLNAIADLNIVGTLDTFRSIASAGASTDGGWDGASVFAAPNMVATPTPTALAESDIRDAVQDLYMMGSSDPDKALVLMTSPPLKRIISEYYYTSTAKAAPFIKTSGEGANQRAVGSVEFIVTDYATLELVPNRFMGEEQATSNGASLANNHQLHIFDPDMFEIVYARGVVTQELAKVGLAERRLVNAYWSTRFHPEAYSLICDISVLLAMTAT